MGWKSIQMQVALTRTVDIGKAHTLEERHGQTSQQLTAGMQLKQDEIKRQQPNETEHAGKPNNDDSNENSNSEREHQEEKNEKKKPKTYNHPYLGNKFDISR